MAGYGDNRPLSMARFAGALAQSDHGKVIYHESHDEAGNSHYEEGGQQVYSARTIMVAINDAPLVGDTRRYAEARVHFAAGMTLLGPGTPMFFMGEEVGASRPYRYADFINAREDYHALRQGAGANLFRFYQDLIRLRLAHPALRSTNIDIIYTHDANRMLAFRRWEGSAGAAGRGQPEQYCLSRRLQHSKPEDRRWAVAGNLQQRRHGLWRQWLD